MAAAQTLAPVIGPTKACRTMDVPRSSFYRRVPKPYGPRPKPNPHPRALVEEERVSILEVCHSSRFADAAPASIVATLLDEGTYLASERTLYRVLSACGEVRERRNQLTHPAYVRPELLATSPNELWSWDIERHEAFLNRAVVKGHRHVLVAASASKLRAA
jgi:putative transposase